MACLVCTGSRIALLRWWAALRSDTARSWCAAVRGIQQMCIPAELVLLVRKYPIAIHALVRGKYHASDSWHAGSVWVLWSQGVRGVWASLARTPFDEVGTAESAQRRVMQFRNLS